MEREELELEIALKSAMDEELALKNLENELRDEIAKMVNNKKNSISESNEKDRNPFFNSQASPKTAVNIPRSSDESPREFTSPGAYTAPEYNKRKSTKKQSIGFFVKSDQTPTPGGDADIIVRQSIKTPKDMAPKMIEERTSVSNCIIS